MIYQGGMELLMMERKHLHFGKGCHLCHPEVLHLLAMIMKNRLCVMFLRHIVEVVIIKHTN
jgi:hypothetical protein